MGARLSNARWWGGAYKRPITDPLIVELVEVKLAPAGSLDTPPATIMGWPYVESEDITPTPPVEFEQPRVTLKVSSDGKGTFIAKPEGTTPRWFDAWLDEGLPSAPQLPPGQHEADESPS